MGWASGTDIAQYIETVLVKYVPKDKLKKEAEKALGVLTNMDWDCQDEVDIFNYLYIMNLIKIDDFYNSEEDAKKDAMDRVKEYKKKFGF